MSKLFPLVALLVAAGLLVAGCGGGDDETTAASESEAAETATSGGGESGGEAGAALTVKMGDFYFSPKNVKAQAGQTTIDAPNEGSAEHELVLFKSDLDPSELPTEANGDVDEEALDKIAEEAGEIADVESGESKSEEFDLKPGKYVMFCNIPGHYAQGMYGTVTVE